MNVNITSFSEISAFSTWSGEFFVKNKKFLKDILNMSFDEVDARLSRIGKNENAFTRELFLQSLVEQKFEQQVGLALQKKIRLFISGSHDVNVFPRGDRRTALAILMKCQEMAMSNMALEKAQDQLAALMSFIKDIEEYLEGSI